MSKFHINPSGVKLSGRCDHIPAMLNMRDPKNPPHNFRPFEGKQTSSERMQGIYFEQCVTGKPYKPRKGDGGEFELWQAGVKSDTLERIEGFAAEARTYLNFDGTEKVGVWYEIELPDFLLGPMEVDYLGYFRLEKGGPMVRGIIDVKFTDDIPFNWDIGGNVSAEILMQAPMYSFGHALQTGDRSLFDQVIALYKAGDSRWQKVIREFGETAEVLPAAYLITESKDTPQFRVNGVMCHETPMIRVQMIEIQVEDYVDMYFRLLGKMDLWMEMAISGNKHDPTIQMLVKPDTYKCLGSNSANMRGRCPLLHKCVYGRNFVQRSSPVTYANIQDL